MADRQSESLGIVRDMTETLSEMFVNVRESAVSGGSESIERNCTFPHGRYHHSCHGSSDGSSFGGRHLLPGEVP